MRPSDNTKANQGSPFYSRSVVSTEGAKPLTRVLQWLEFPLQINRLQHTLTNTANHCWLTPVDLTLNSMKLTPARDMDYPSSAGSQTARRALMPSPTSLNCCRPLLAAPRLEMRREPERAACAHLAAGPRLPPHQRRQTPGDRQPQARSLVLTRA